MAKQIMTYEDNRKQLSIEVHGDFLVIETCFDGYNVDQAYIPHEPLFFALRKLYGFDD